MANRRFNQFSYSFERQPVHLMGHVTVTDVGAFAALVTQGLTLTAVLMGSAGNSITLTITTGATAGAEVITVSGNAITAQIESGVSTVTQVRTALNLSAAAAALVTTTGTSGSAVVAATVLPLAGGDDTDFTIVGLAGVDTIAQTGTGVYKITLTDTYAALLSAMGVLQRAAAVDLDFQMVSETVASTKFITFRTKVAATETNLAVSDRLYLDFTLRNSSGGINAS